MSLVRGTKMFEYLERATDIAAAQRKFEIALKRQFAKLERKNIGHPGGRESQAELASEGRYWFWSTNLRRSKTPRRLNWFGVLSDNPGVSITVEINISYRGRNDRCSGFFARDATGRIYLFHSGRVGGGAAGVGKDSFLTWAKLEGNELYAVNDASGDFRMGLLVAALDDEQLGVSIKRYIDLVRSFKTAVRKGTISRPLFRRQQSLLRSYFPESYGRRRGYRKAEFDFETRHGEIVHALKIWRQSHLMKRGWSIAKNVGIDLGVAAGQRLIELFEVKPSAERQHIYSAIGQLIVHGGDSGCRKVMVLPEKTVLATDLSQALRKQNVEIVQFRLKKKDVTILGKWKPL